MVHQIHKLFEQLKLIPGQNMEVQKLLFSFIGWNYMHLVWFPCISCMEFRPPWSDFHPLAWKSNSSIAAWCGSADFNNRVLVLMVSYFHPFIVILICLPALRHLNIQKIFFMDRIVLPKYCFSIANVVVTSFTELVHMYYPEWLGECSSLRTQRCKNNLMRRWNCKPSSFTRVTSCESYGSSLLL